MNICIYLKDAVSLAVTNSFTKKGSFFILKSMVKYNDGLIIPNDRQS